METTNQISQNANTIFEKGYVIIVDYASGRVLKRLEDDENAEQVDISSVFPTLDKSGVFKNDKNSYVIKLSGGLVELSFEKSEGETGPVYMITVAEKARTLKEIMVDESFEDLRYTLGNDYAELFRNGRRYLTVPVKARGQEDVESWVLVKSKNFYSLEGEGFWDGSFRVANTANVTCAFTVRKLGTGFSFIDTYGEDMVLLSFFSRVLTGQGTNRSILVSWGTAMGKTSLLISLLNFMNAYSYDDICKHIYVKWLAKIRPEYAKFDPKSVSRKQLENIMVETLGKDGAESAISQTMKYIKDSWLAKLVANFSGKSVFSIEKPIERKFVNDSMSFVQTEISYDEAHVEDKRMYDRGMTMDEISTSKMLLQATVALQSNPSLVYFSEIKYAPEYAKYLEIILQGMPTIATNHAGSIWQNLDRIVSLYPDEKAPKQSIVSGMGWLMNLRRYDADDETYLFSYEYLILDDSLLTLLRNLSVKEFASRVTKAIMPKDYVSHEYSLIRQIFNRYKKNGDVVGIKTFAMSDYEDLMSVGNISKTVDLYIDMDLSTLQSFSTFYLDEMKKREDIEL